MSERTCGECVNFKNGCSINNPESQVKDCNEYEPVQDNNATKYVDLSEGAKKSPYPDMVIHPPHYSAGSIECIKAIEAFMSPEGFQDYCKGNVIKYTWRFRQKNGLEDLKKARVYLNWMIESVEKEQENNESL